MNNMNQSGHGDDSFRRCVNRSVFNMNHWSSTSDIRDGTSNTIAISEVVTTSTAGTRNIHGGAIHVAATGDDGRAFRNGIETDCFNQRDPANRRMMAGTANTSIRRGFHGFSGRPPDTSFTTTLPPGSPSCVNSAGSRDTWGSLAPSSNHPGGVNVGLFDGSVRFIPETINWRSAWVVSGFQGDGGRGADGQPDQGGRMGGPSDFGVWGAMGSRAGGESVVIP